jgi:hypothetical protein
MVYLIVGSLVSPVLFLLLWGIYQYYALSVGVCYRAGVWIDPAVKLLHFVGARSCLSHIVHITMQSSLLCFLIVVFPSMLIITQLLFQQNALVY